MIPLHFHYISFKAPKERGGKPFGYANYLCLYSAIKTHPEALFHFYFDDMPIGKWFELLKPFLTLHQIEPPKTIFGQPLKRIEHQADIARLEILTETGGIYLDTDMFICKSLEPLLDHRYVMGIENGQGLCNGVILTEPHSPFIEEWRKAYHPESTLPGAGFDPNGWGEMSVKFPEQLAKRYGEYATILSTYAFFQPSGSSMGLELLFDDPTYTNPEAFAHHLWASQAWSKYLAPMTPEKVLKNPGYFYQLVRKTFHEKEILGQLEWPENELL